MSGADSWLLGLGLALAGYLAGSIPNGYLVGRYVFGVDVRRVGSGNIGGTNVARVGGKGWGPCAAERAR